jgi:hypothetical protein
MKSLPLKVKNAMATRWCYGRGGWPKEKVAEMYADYVALGSLEKVGAKWNRSQGQIAELLEKHGFRKRDPKKSDLVKRRRKLANGCFAPLTPATPAEIDAMIAKIKRVQIPEALKQEWRHWPMEKRGRFIARLRVKLNKPDTRPQFPYSDNVEPFDYTSPRAWEIARKANAGFSSQTQPVKLKLASVGVIWRETLYFWSSSDDDDHYYPGPFKPGIGRPPLNHIIWENANGRPVPAKFTVIHQDGNKNNFAPANLALRSMAQCALQNSVSNRLKTDPRNPDLLRKNAHILKSMRLGHSQMFVQKSRAKTAVLLSSFQKENHEHVNTINQLSRAK